MSKPGSAHPRVNSFTAHLPDVCTGVNKQNEGSHCITAQCRQRSAPQCSRSEGQCATVKSQRSTVLLSAAGNYFSHCSVATCREYGARRVNLNTWPETASWSVCLPAAGWYFSSKLPLFQELINCSSLNFGKWILANPLAGQWLHLHSTGEHNLAAVIGRSLRQYEALVG